MCKLSIIIPVYNVETWLRACLDSVIVPGLEGYEIVAVNDGSTDRSGEILADYAERFPALVHVVTTANGGLGHARNVGLSLAGGEYVQFLDSDDTLAPGAVAEMLDALDGSFDIGVFDLVTVDESGRQLRYGRGAERTGSFTLSEYPELLLCPPNAVNKLWRKALFTNHAIAFPDRMWFEDLATTPRLYLSAQRIACFPRPWYRYLERRGSITQNANTERNLDMIRALDLCLGAYEQAGQFEAYRPQLCAMAAYHELLTSNTRVNRADPNSPVQDRLTEDFLRRFPDWRENPYLQSYSRTYRLLLRLITGKHRRALHLLILANELRKRKNI